MLIGFLIVPPCVVAASGFLSSSRQAILVVGAISLVPTALVVALLLDS